MTRRSLLAALVQAGPSLPDIRTVPPDLNVPVLGGGPPVPGARVRVPARGDLYHVLYLPEDWQRNRRYPLIVEFAGNGGYRNGYGDVSTGVPEGSNLGYGISGGRGFLWLCLPFVDPARQAVATLWWGDAGATVDYCRRVVPAVCEEYGGDASRILLCGFSRGSIACNYIGLRDDAIAALWRAFVCYSHYDGVRPWPYADSSPEAARRRLARLGGRPQFICHEGSVEATRQYLESTGVTGDFTMRALPYRNHNDAWVLRPVALREFLRQWVQRVMA